MRIPLGNREDAARSQGLKNLSARVTLAVAFALTAVKLGGWLLTGSMALMASAVDSLVDAGASFVTLIGVRYAQRPPDLEHRFGHGKGEAVAAFTQATFLAGAAFVLAFQSIQRLIFPVPLVAIEVGVVLIAGSLLVACGLVAMQSYVVARTGSTAIAADRAHYVTDVALNAAVLAALGVTQVTGWTRADPAFALAISGYMLWNAYGITREALEQLLDRELPSEERRKIQDAVRACTGVRDVHDLRTRFSGDRIFVEYHLEVDPGLTVDIGHAIGDSTEIAVQDLLPGTVEATAHIEPHGIADARLDDAVAGKS
jgi:cation diffusion facilitator family transporter